MDLDLHGMPSWADLGSPDLATSKAFYRGLFGWDSYTLSGDTFGDYEIFVEGAPGLGVAGVQALADDTQFPSWTCYFRVDDVDACVQAILEAGGQRRLEPTDIAHVARIALFADPQGAEFGIWQPGPSGETRLIGDRSAARWVELACRDIAAARTFYGKVFRWSAGELDDPRFAYTRWRIENELVAGAVVMDDQWPPSYPTHWMPYFEAADCDATTARAAELGARVRMPPIRIDVGKFSMLTDPTGARFGIIALDAQERSRTPIVGR